MASLPPIKPASARERRGFTLVEVLVALVLGAVVAMLLVQLLGAHVRVAGLLVARGETVHNARALTEQIASELRSVDPGGIVAAEAAAIAFRSPRAWGVLCSHTAESAAVLFAAAAAPVLRDGDELLALPFAGDGGGWRFFEVTDRTGPGARWDAAAAECAALGAEPLPEPGNGSRLRLYAPRDGAPTLGVASGEQGLPRGTVVHLFDPVRYEVAASGGSHWVRRNTGPAMLMQPIAGPVPAEGGLRFRYLDADGRVIDPSATSPERIRQVEVSVTTLAGGGAGAGAADSASVRVLLRNR